jgi:hypothetical protein
MNLKNLFLAIKTPGDFFSTFKLFRKFGISWKEALKNAVDCVVNHRFVLL